MNNQKKEEETVSFTSTYVFCLFLIYFIIQNFDYDDFLKIISVFNIEPSQASDWFTRVGCNIDQPIADRASAAEQNNNVS